MAQYLQSLSPFLFTLVTCFLTILGTFFVKLYHARMLVVKLQRRGLPVAPEHSFLFGHLLYLKKFLDRIPADAHYQYAVAMIAREVFPHTGAYYLDLWPLGTVFLTIVSPQITTEVTQTNPALSSERPWLIRDFCRPITGGLTIFDLSEEEWRPWRAVFAKGFQGDHIMSLVPAIVQETEVYAETLSKLAAKDEICFLDPITLRFTIDIIGKTILNTTLGAQKGYNVLADSMLSQIRWHNNGAGVNSFGHLNPVRRFVQWRNGRAMDRFIGAELDKRYEEYKNQLLSNSVPEDTSGTQKKFKSAIDLVLQAYLSTSSSSSKSALPDKLDPSFRSTAIRQIRLFIFVGHDSTASTLCYTFYLLSKHPQVLSRLRAEHNSVLGPNPLNTPALLSRNPHLVNSLPYTLAVLKESLRLFSPAGTTRAGKPNTSITDDAGNSLPTENATLWILHNEIHQSPSYWVRGEEFLPERWLVPPGDELYPKPGSWRPFELGPRNCIAQSLVLVELRVVLAVLARRFEVKDAYEEWDLSEAGKGKRRTGNGVWKLESGERAYHVAAGAAHPVDGFPCRVSCV
ncbi:sterigmatocystin biosynthesis P450 monooxygenase StcS [Naviculisporaceae sp. PSN 640]